MQEDNLVVCQFPDQQQNKELYDLVNKLQIHTCGNYCMRGGDNCRFQFPKEPSSRNYFDNNGRSHYKRTLIDSCVNNYNNPYLLMLTQSAMDIQVNQGKDGLFYLAKYLSKVDSEVTLEHNMENTKDRMRARVVGAVDAGYFLCGCWNKHCNSRGVIFINSCLPGHDERRLLKSNIGHLPPNSIKLFYNSHIDKYLNRHQQLQDLTLAEYFTYYILTQGMDTEEAFHNEGPADVIGNYDYRGYIRRAPTEHDPRIRMNLPKKCTEKFDKLFLHMLKHTYTAIEYNPVVLASTGVAAHTAGGQASDRFLDLTLDQPSQCNPIRIDDYLKAYNKTVFFDWRMFHVECSQDARYSWATGLGDWNQQAVW